MKKIIFAVFFFSGTAVFAQHRNQPKQPPVSVKRSFEHDNPKLNASWTWKNNEWHATFKDNNNRDVDAYYDNYGRRKDTRIRWNKTDVPHDLDEKINKTYHSTNYDAIRIERPNAQPIFQITLQTGGKTRKVYMDEHGKPQKYTNNH